MGLAKTGYKDAIRGTTKVNVGIDADGYLIPPGGQAVANKKFQINKVSADNSLTDNTEVLNFFLSLANGVQDSLSNSMNVNWDADNFNNDNNNNEEN